MPITRRSAGLAAFAFHTATVVVLHMHLSWAIMPWNLALAWAALHLLFLSPAPERPSGGWRTWRPFDRDRLRTALLVVVFAYPLLVYVGLLDLYLGHHVYSSDGGSAQVCEADGRCSTFSIDVSGAAVGAALPARATPLRAVVPAAVPAWTDAGRAGPPVPAPARPHRWHRS